MASITIRNLDERLKAKLRLRAAKHARSMEEEVREILSAALSRRAATPQDLAAAIQDRFADLGGVDLEVPRRDVMRAEPSFEG